ncbi:unnamed protein product [Tilletia caries]|nr:unnamed protein product [Tilletia caries]
MRPYWLDRLDEIDESFELLDRERRHHGRNPRGSAAAGSSTPKGPLPNIPKRAVNDEPDESELGTTSEEEDAQFKEGVGPGEDDAIDFYASESEPHKGKKKVSAEQNAIKRSKWKQRCKAKAAGKSSKPPIPISVHQLLRQMYG